MNQIISILCVAVLLLEPMSVPAWQQPAAPEAPASAQAANAPEKNAGLLAEGTEIKLKFAQNLSTKSAVVGDKVEFVVAESVMLGDKVAIPAGTRVLGVVTEGKESEDKRNDAKKLAVRVEYLKAGGARVKLRSEKIDPQKAKVDKGKVVAATILFGVSGLLIALSAKRLVVPEGTPVTAFVAEDAWLSPAPSRQ